MLTDHARGLRGRATRMLHRLAPGVTILLYHRVTTVETDPQLLCVSPQRFDEQLAYLSEHFTPLSLREMVKRMQSGRLPKRGVVLTFDDGYADNLLLAKPILEKHGFPATVYVTSGCIGSPSEFYWDDLDRLLLSSHPLPERLELAIAGQKYTWAIDGGHDIRWDLLDPAAPSSRGQAYKDLCRLLRPLPYTAQQQLIAEVRRWSTLPGARRDSHRTLSAQQVVELGSTDLVEIGAHTVDHPMLSALPLDAQRQQIVASKRSLEYLLGKPVTSFSYPYGARSCYTQDTVRLVREAGYASACSNFPGQARAGDSLFELPRVLVRDWTADRLEAELREVAAA